MAIIVDKNKKRETIALACKDLVINGSIKDITISKITSQAGIAKGSFYDYFLNKEDLVFAIVNLMMEQYNTKTKQKLSKAKNIEEKLQLFAEFFHSDEDKELRKLYKEFIAISLTNENEQMVEFQTQCYITYKTWLEQIINEAIQNNELKPEVLSLTDGLFAMAKGIYITAQTTNAIPDLKICINDYINTIYQLTKVEK